MVIDDAPLKLIDSFTRVLAEYIPNPEQLTILRQTPFVLLAAPTAAGRNTLIKTLLKEDTYYYIVSDTTRPPRINNGQAEQNGQEYWFRSEEDFLKDLDKGRYLEAAIIHDQQVSGISMREIEKAHQAGKIAITDIDVQGCRTLETLSDNIIPIFILPPRYEIWMQRLDGRGAMNEVEKKRRLASAASEIDYALLSGKFTFIVNDSLEGAAKQLDAIVQKTDDKAYQQAAIKHAKQLLSELMVKK
jgi:guanylate kinase